MRFPAFFKHSLDKRYSKEYVVTHDKTKLLSQPVKTAAEILKKVLPDTDVIGIDEAQFFTNDILGICQDLANSGRRVVVAGLDQDFRGVTFEPMAKLLAVAEYVTKNLAICVICGNPAVRNQRLTKKGGQIVIGGSDTYEARCRRCFRPGEDEPELFEGEGGDSE